MNDSSPSTPPSDSHDTSNIQLNMNVTTGEQEARPSPENESSLPFRLLLASNLDPEGPTPSWEETDARHHIGKKSVADLMAEMTPTLSVEVENRLASAPATWTVDLSFPAFKAFQPEQLARQMAPTHRLLEVRDLVQSVADGALDAESFRTELAELDIDIDWADALYRLLTDEDGPPSSSAPPPDTEASDDTLGRVLNMVDTDTPENAAPSSGDGASLLNDIPDPSGDASGTAEVLASAVDSPRAPDDASAAQHIIRRLNDALHDQVHALLTHPAVRQLESAWRGLDFLADRLDLRANVELLVLPAGPDELHEALHHQVLLPEHDDTNEEPPTSLILVDHAFGHEHVDLEQLADLAGTGESLQTPVVTAVSPEFFGMERLQGLQKLPALRPQLQGHEYVEWNRLREKDASAFLGLTLPSFLLRAPYADDASTMGVTDEQGLFGNGALAVGVAAARSFVETGWATHLSDYAVEPPSETSPSAPLLSTRLSGSMQSELARAGFIVLDEAEDRKAVHVAHTSSVREPKSHEDPSAAAEARMKLTLPCRLFASRAAHHLFELKHELDLDRPLTAICNDLSTAMAALLDVPPSEAIANSTAEEQASAPSDNSEAKTSPNDEASDDDAPLPPVLVEQAENVDLPNHDVIAVRLRPPNDILSENARLAMALRVPNGS